jgi:hypothetical protein
LLVSKARATVFYFASIGPATKAILCGANTVETPIVVLFGTKAVKDEMKEPKLGKIQNSSRTQRHETGI